MQKYYKAFAILFLGFLVTSCSIQKQISSQAHQALLNDSDLATAHIGISVFDPETNKYLYNYQGEKYFTPASNTKLFTLYAGLKYLGDSLVAARYKMEDGTLILQATGDPTFLHPDFKNQPLLSFLQQKNVGKISINTAFASESFGRGWAWDDYMEDYMPERDPFPMYGDLATVTFNGDSLQTIPPAIKQLVIGTPPKDHIWQLSRRLGTHFFTVDTTAGTNAAEKKVTMAMERGGLAAHYLADTLHKEVGTEYLPLSKSESTAIYSQPKDSLFRLMMLRSDNFYAEQTLLMVSNKRLGTMNDVAIIDTLLSTDFQGLPQKPRWVDGSGLSRYNLFTPKDLTWLLNKMSSEFGMEKMKIILPGANQGSLEGLYKGYEQHIFAKTGSLSNNVALSGYIITRKNRTLLFSVLINNYMPSSRSVRKKIEQFVTGMIDRN